MQILRKYFCLNYKDITDISLKTAKDRAPVELDQQATGRLSRMDAMQQQSMDTAKKSAE